MSTLEFAPTVNEILGAREERKLRKRQVPAWTKFKKNDHVSFIFNGLTKIGRITTVAYTGLSVLYNISTPSGQWYKGIEQGKIISKVESQMEPGYGRY